MISTSKCMFPCRMECSQCSNGADREEITGCRLFCFLDDHDTGVLSRASVREGFAKIQDTGSDLGQLPLL